MSFRFRLALSVAVLAFGVGLVVLFGASSQWERAHRREKEAHLRSAARQLVAQLPELLRVPPETRHRRAGELGALMGLRVTLVAADGTVVADSRVPYAHLPLLENHGQRPEVRRALELGEGSAHRRSATTGVFTWYLALRTEEQGQAWVVRVAEEEGAPSFPWLWLLPLAAASAGVGWLAQRLLASWQREIYQHLAPWCELPASAETPAVAYEADRRFRKLKEEATRELEACRQALSRVVEGVVLLDREQVVRFANPAALELLGKLPEGEPLWEHCQNPQLLALVGEGLAGAESRHGEVTHQGRTLAVTLTSLQHPVLALGLLVRDISPQARFEAARRAFVADLAHELRTPVTVLGGVLEELKDRGVAPELADMLGRQVKRLSRFAADLEELVRIETGRLQLELAPVELLALAREVAADFAPHAQARGVSLAVGGEPVTITTDRLRLAQVVSNLVDNAIRYNRPGGSATVRVAPHQEGAQLVVEDTGLGIPESEIPLVFQRFYRVRRGEAEATGSGLGLAIVKHLVARLGGRVHLASKLGEGTRVTVELPAKASSELPAPSRP
ncbi:ATP-binding protein [Thermoanaerobaculum aquaticum]|uniref:ATP-binding protein n=1 Tax=Thermoanaerobaculum aquaticum TaxID=1312852 RepID=UPI001267B6CF|nr:ATP-binding protein [Thermoanaerobaculum aquaticum]